MTDHRVDWTINANLPPMLGNVSGWLPGRPDYQQRGQLGLAGQYAQRWWMESIVNCCHSAVSRIAVPCEHCMTILLYSGRALDLLQSGVRTSKPEAVILERFEN